MKILSIDDYQEFEKFKIQDPNTYDYFVGLCSQYMDAVIRGTNFPHRDEKRIAGILQLIMSSAQNINERHPNAIPLEARTLDTFIGEFVIKEYTHKRKLTLL